ncbi:MAG: hypothetical protein RL885_26965 [Planctomycetota bacterium]
MVTVWMLAAICLSWDVPQELSRSPVHAGYEWVLDRHPLKRAGARWNTPAKRVEIKRRERQAAGSAWSSQEQSLSTSYAITIARARIEAATAEISDLYVAGVHDNGTVVIERWRFSYPALGQPGGGGGYVPLANRPMPVVTRSVLYMASPGIGPIRALEVDPQNRFLLLISHGDSTLFRLDVPSPHQLTPILNVGQQPQLADVRSILYRKHPTEGPKYVLSELIYWKHAQSLDRVANSKTLLLSDPNDDGTFDSTELLTRSEWSNRGYHLSESWEHDRTQW